jgi:hypothetical protein
MSVVLVVGVARVDSVDAERFDLFPFQLKPAAWTGRDPGGPAAPRAGELYGPVAHASGEVTNIVDGPYGPVDDDF